jgi:hypothetical protein
MRPKSIVDWAEVISALAVVITLFYVGYQVKQNTETVRTTVLNDIFYRLKPPFHSRHGREHGNTCSEKQTIALIL